MSDVVSIRLAVDADAAKIAAISRDYIEDGLRWNWTTERVLRQIRHREMNVVVAIVAGRMAGFGIMKYREDDAHLLLFAVHPSFQRRGVGTALMQWLEASAVAAGIELIWLEARADNAGALAFYRSLGYRTLDRMTRYYSGIEDAVRIGKDLAATQPTSKAP